MATSPPLPDQFPLESFEGFPEDALCVICQSPALDNVSLCLKGHNACRTCADRLNQDYGAKCATCRGDIHKPNVPGTGPTWMSNTALNNLVDSFQIKCPNVKKGCTHMCKMGEMSDHMDSCEYREIACKCSSCPWKGPACKWHDHMKEVDHGKYLVDMMLFTQQVCATMCEKFEKAETDHAEFKKEVMDPFKTQLSCIGQGCNQIQESLRVIKGHTDKQDGSSARSKRRDRKNQKDVDDANAEAERAQEEKRLVTTERDTLKRKVEELEAQPPPPDPAPFCSVDQFQNCQTARDRFFRERDEARHEGHMAQQRIHDQHAMLKKMMPQALGPCPCSLHTCDAGGGTGNQHRYKRGFVARHLQEQD